MTRLKRSTLTGDDSLHAPLKYCQKCGQEMAIVIEETPASREAHYTCHQFGCVEGCQITMSTNTEPRQSGANKPKQERPRSRSDG